MTNNPAPESSRPATSPGSVLARMSREIQTPLNEVLGMLELLSETAQTVDQRHAAAAATWSGRALFRILNNAVDFAKIEAGELELATVPFDLGGLLTDTVRSFSSSAGERSIDLNVEVRESVPSLLIGDPTRVRQIVVNLLSNAIRFTDDGEVLVQAESKIIDDGRCEVTLVFRDTGSGIAEDKLETIFRAFHYHDTTQPEASRGIGIGLAVTDQLVEMMHGGIDVESDLGEGTEFRVSIPFEVSPAAGATRPRSDRPLVGLLGRRVLIVDDSPTARRIVREVVESGGALAEEATNAGAGLGLLNQATNRGDAYDVVIVDATMRGKDGFAFARDVCQSPSLDGTRLLMLATAAEPFDRERALAHGLRGYLSKPTRRADLVMALQAVLGLRGPGEGVERRMITDESLAMDRRSMRILVVDHVEGDRSSTAAMLRNRGHTVDVLADGGEAIGKVEAEPYDVVLMEVDLPGRDGPEVTRAIRSLPNSSSLPVIAVMSDARREERVRCAEAGMTGFLVKPLRSDELYGTVEGWLRLADDTSAAP